MARAFGPRIGLALRSWGVAPGWYEAAPLALATAVHLRAKGPFHTSMGQRPMWGIAPRPGHNTSPSANGATHPFTAYRLGVADVGCAGLWNGPSALVSGWRSLTWGVAPGWYEAAPLALATAVHLRAKGPVHTSGAPPHVGHRPAPRTQQNPERQRRYPSVHRMGVGRGGCGLRGIMARAFGPRVALAFRSWGVAPGLEFGPD